MIAAALAIVLAFFVARTAFGEEAIRIAAPQASPEDAAEDGEVKTLKERLSDKASDEQRIDNCRVPLDRRGVKSRPDCAAPSAPPLISASPNTQ